VSPHEDNKSIKSSGTSNNYHYPRYNLYELLSALSLSVQRFFALLAYLTFHTHK
jgi:hypothetical protein